MSDRKYQVFLSSTFADLKEERLHALLALLEVDCIPIGMELFPPADEESLDYIRRMIEQCDYYVLILAGRYGTIDTKTGLSYTEIEYNLAQEMKKPTIAFYHENPDVLPSGMCEHEARAQKKLEAFRSRVLSGRLSRAYTNASSLRASITVGLHALRKTRPLGGWVPARLLPPDDVQKEIGRLNDQVRILEKQIENLKNGTSADHCIDTMRNFLDAQGQMRSLINEAVRAADHVRIRVMAVSLNFSADFLIREIIPLFNLVPLHKKLYLELLMVAPDHLATLGLNDWSDRASTVQTLVRKAIDDHKNPGGLIDTGRLSIDLRQYRNIPHWHGLLVNDTYLFMGRTKWTIDLSSKTCALSVGQEVYRLFSSTDEFGGSDRVDMFRRWFDYYVFTGEQVVSGGTDNDVGRLT